MRTFKILWFHKWAIAEGLTGLDHKSAQDRLDDVVLPVQSHVLQRVGDHGAERGGRNYDQGRLTDESLCAAVCEVGQGLVDELIEVTGNG